MVEGAAVFSTTRDNICFTPAKAVLPFSGGTRGHALTMKMSHRHLT
jgi:hypothetical protein